MTALDSAHELTVKQMGTIPLERQYAVRLFLRSLASQKPGEIDPDYVYEDPRGRANTVLGHIGQDYPDDLETMALESLVHATLAFCDNPQDADVIARFEDAGRWLLEISSLAIDGAPGGMSDRLLPLIGLPFRGVHGIEDVVTVIDIVDGPDDHP